MCDLLRRLESSISGIFSIIHSYANEKSIRNWKLFHSVKSKMTAAVYRLVMPLRKKKRFEETFFREGQNRQLENSGWLFLCMRTQKWMFCVFLYLLHNKQNKQGFIELNKIYLGIVVDPKPHSLLISWMDFLIAQFCFSVKTTGCL